MSQPMVPVDSCQASGGLDIYPAIISKCNVNIGIKNLRTATLSADKRFHFVYNIFGRGLRVGVGNYISNKLEKMARGPESGRGRAMNDVTCVHICMHTFW